VEMMKITSSEVQEGITDNAENIAISFLRLKLVQEKWAICIL